MDDYGPQFNNDPEFSDGGAPHEIRKFMFDITRGITAKIPENVTDFVPKPSIKEIEGAAVYLARNSKNVLDGRPPMNTNMYMNATVIMTRAHIHYAVETGQRIVTEEDYCNYCRKMAEEAFFTVLQSDGYVELLWGNDPDNPEMEISVTETGKKNFAELYLKESRKNSFFTETLESLIGGPDEANKLIERHTSNHQKEYFSDGLGSILKDILGYTDDQKDASKDIEPF